MKSCIIFTILVTLVTGYVDVWNMVHFSRSCAEIQECLERTEWWNIIREYVNDDWGQWILEEFSRNLKTKTVRQEYINETASEVVNILRRENVLNNAQMSHVRTALARALIDCSDSQEENLNDQVGYYNLPLFIQEEPEVADLLNFILVDARSLYEGSLGLRTLDSYFQEALSLIERCVHVTRTSYNLMNSLERMWHRRTDLFYHYNGSPEYIRHVFSRDRPRPYTRDDPSLFLSRRFAPLNVRNPIDENDERVFEISRYHSINWGDHNRNYYYFVPPEVCTTSRSYFKRLMNLFFRYLFLYTNLMEAGIISFDNSNNDGPLPRHLVPGSLERILYNDTAYDRYLFNRQNIELDFDHAISSSVHISYNEVLERGHRIAVPDLLLMYSYRVIQTAAATTNLASNLTSDVRFEYPPLETLWSNNTINTTNGFFVSSSTSGYEDLKRGDAQVFQDTPENKSPKNHRRFNQRNDISDVENRSLNNAKEIKYLRKLFSDRFYGYSLGFSKKENSQFTELQDILSSLFVGQNMHKHERLMCHSAKF